MTGAEQERHVGPLDAALVSAGAVEIIMTIGLGVIDDFAARAAAERVLRLAQADQAAAIEQARQEGFAAGQEAVYRAMEDMGPPPTPDETL